jgi:uncharacterized oligopeptide transporter (OPT) family protein
MGASAIAGAIAGALVAAPAYLLLVRVHGIASPRLPMPSALQWNAVAQIVARGTAALPPGALGAVLAAAVAGAMLALLESTPVRRWIPSPFALGVGVLVPVHVAAAIACGGLVAFAASRWRPIASERVSVAAAGLIAGESFVGMIATLLLSLGMLGP